MNKEIKDKWVAALRSGDYKQGKSALQMITAKGRSYCCLGVLCDLLAIPHESKPCPTGFIIYYEGVMGSLPQSALDIVGNDLPVSGLIAMNDDDNKDFNQIADYIEVNL